MSCKNFFNNQNSYKTFTTATLALNNNGSMLITFVDGFKLFSFQTYPKLPCLSPRSSLFLSQLWVLLLRDSLEIELTRIEVRLKVLSEFLEALLCVLGPLVRSSEIPKDCRSLSFGGAVANGLSKTSPSPGLASAQSTSSSTRVERLEIGLWGFGFMDSLLMFLIDHL